MDVLREFLNSLPVAEQAELARRAGTTIGYLRKAMSAGHRLGADIVVALERESDGRVRAEELRPDIDWPVIRGSHRHCAAPPRLPA